ncbi:MAG: CARDB domain-containing protein [Candidatus Thermoplasmatota archaeon]|nr:CARDB domain-containing protein [Candidatus Thermoplasmatota archaeon]
MLEPYTIFDDNGFPSLSVKFTCSNIITVKIIGPDSKVIYSDFFFKGTHNTSLHIGEFRHTIKPGKYVLRVSNNDDQEIFSEKIYFKGPNISILSYEQKWLKKSTIDDYSLFGLKFFVKNSGDIPVYPYQLTTIIDSETTTALTLPCVVMPDKTQYIECFIYKESEPKNASFSIEIKDINNNILVSEPILKNVVDDVFTKQFIWSWNNKKYKVNIPKSDYLYDYYSNLNRNFNKDYSLYVFDPYDDQYIDVVTNYLMTGFTGHSDVDKINYIASFIQNLEYKKDNETNDSHEYPNYPIESLFNDNIGRDCEDKAILTASILKNMDYNVALLRFPDHMAVGVNLSKEAIANFQYYVDNYYFLETTTPGNPCGFVPSEYKNLVSDVIVYPVTARPLLTHKWKNDSITVYSNTEKGDFVKVQIIIQNLGNDIAKNFKIEAGFYTNSDIKINYESINITSLNPGMKKEITFSVTIPKNIKTLFKTKIYINNEVVDEKESASFFP